MIIRKNDWALMFRKLIENPLHTLFAEVSFSFVLQYRWFVDSFFFVRNCKSISWADVEGITNSLGVLRLMTFSR